MKTIIFIYHNEETEKIKILDLDNSQKQHNELIKKGWKHTASINPEMFIENLFNECSDEEIANEIRQLNKI